MQARTSWPPPNSATIAAPAALMNAITDAIGVKDLPMPATAQTVWRALQKKA